MKHYTLEEFISKKKYIVSFEFFNSRGELEPLFFTDKYMTHNSPEASNLLKELQNQGFDEYSYLHDEDKEIMQSFVDEINKKSFSKAKENGKAVYSHYSLGVSSDIYKCCDTLLFNLLDYDDYEVNPGHGGKRLRAGRKSPFVGGTALIRVPKYEKEGCRKLIDFLVDMQCKDTPVYTALYWIIRDAELHIEEMEKSGINTDEDRKNIEVIEELKNKIPNFSIAKY